MVVLDEEEAVRERVHRQVGSAAIRGAADEQGSATAWVAAARFRRPDQQDEDLVQTDGAAKIVQHSH